MKINIDTNLDSRIGRIGSDSADSIVDSGRLDALRQQPIAPPASELSPLARAQRVDTGAQLLDFTQFDRSALKNRDLITSPVDFPGLHDQKNLVNFILEPLGFSD